VTNWRKLEEHPMKTYTFHVSLPGTGRVWRKVELREDQTLEDLHFAIQDAYDWDADHLYSFFMSGKAWDTDTEYALPNGVDPWGSVLDDAASNESERNDKAQVNNEADEEADQPLPLTNPLTMLPPELREQALRALYGNDMPLEEMEAHLTQFWEMLHTSAMLDAQRDVRETSLQSLRLRPKQEFMYLFDYGDEWRFKVRVHAIGEADPEAQYPRLVETVGRAPNQYWSEEDYDK
jgi:hypothetical protein